MNNTEISTVTYRSNFQELFYRYFSNEEVFLRVKEGKIPVKFYGFSENHAAFRIPHVKSMSREATFYAKTNDEMAYAFVTFLEQQEAGVFIFIPQRIQIISQNRSEDRKTTTPGRNNRNLVFITDFLPDFILENQINSNEKKVDHLRDIIKSEIDTTALHLRIFLCNELKNDHRMQYFKKQRIPIYIPDFTRMDAGSDQKKITYYINNIYAQDYFLKNNKEYISEISVPLLYNGKLPYGYILVNGAIALDNNVFKGIKKAAIFADRLFKDFEIFTENCEKMLVSNISESGFAITINDRRLIRYFKKESQAAMDMILPEQKKASLLAEIKYITIQHNKNIKIGFQIIDIDALSEVNLDDFRESLTGDKQ